MVYQRSYCALSSSSLPCNSRFLTTSRLHRFSSMDEYDWSNDGIFLMELLADSSNEIDDVVIRIVKEWNEDREEEELASRASTHGSRVGLSKKRARV